MVDIHCHLLPGMDDGSKSLHESVAMAEMAVADGIEYVVCTPHANSEYLFDPAVVRERRDKLLKELAKSESARRLRLGIGCDFHLSYENLMDIRNKPTKYSINHKNYLLVEFDEFAIPPTMEEMLHNLRVMGLYPIITHPERNALICAQQDRLRQWVRLGCYVQITAQSVLGRWGEGVKRQVEAWMDENIVHFFASDAHNTVQRPLKLREAYDVVAQGWGAARAQALFHDNPLAAFEGRELSYQPEQSARPKRSTRSTRRKRFLFF